MDTHREIDLRYSWDQNGDLQALLQELFQLQAKQRRLERAVEGHQCFEDYLNRVLEAAPKGCQQAGDPGELRVEALVDYYERLLTASWDAQKHLELFSKMSQAAHQCLESLEQTHRTLIPNLKTQLCQLQKKCHLRQGRWWQLEHGPTSQKDMCSSSAGGKAAAADKPGALGARSPGVLWVPCWQLPQEFMLDKTETLRLASQVVDCSPGHSPKDQTLQSHPRPFRKHRKRAGLASRAPLPGTRSSEPSGPL
ncbi:uncharacterized protein CCDC197 isoform X2 [Erinaceus europaeus]|uniref:Uncharacterized protein CCDC197 isoform X2 n=1 Tax=Erinaceus europaeus TaxID=9365 RepID=A0ABM3WK61_ERIEU|nr:uncharacterized protein CCDC197 isoform X2 [Erinaceus europaeus]